MHLQSILSTSLLTTALLFNLFSPAHAATAKRVDDTDVAQRGQCYVESWYANSNRTHELMFMPSCAISDQSEVSVGYERLSQRDSASDHSLILQSKSRLSDPSSTIQKALAWGGTVNLDRRANDKQLSNIFINLPFTAALTNSSELLVNLGLLHDRDQHRNFGIGGIGLQQQISADFSVFAETFRIDDSGKGWQAGLILPIPSDWQFDISLLNSRPDEKRRHSILFAISSPMTSWF